MKSCFMFGHADCPDDMLPRIEAAIEEFYMQREISAFYVGDRGRFDSLAATAVKRAKLRHPDIQLHRRLSEEGHRLKCSRADHNRVMIDREHGC